MKKAYSKPLIVFEDFHLSANIAASCGKPTNHAQFVCQPVPGMILFLDTVSGRCQYTPDDAGLCYQSYTEENTIFTS